MRILMLCVLSAALSAQGGEKFKISQAFECSGMCDASAAIPVGTNLFLVANDEDSALRLYRAGTNGAPLRRIPLGTQLALRGHSLETDIEGAALIGHRAFWISSHGRNVDGKERANRGRFFATDIRGTGVDVQAALAGTPCTTLLPQLISEPKLARFGLGRASQLAPKEKGALNIEGLAATPEGHLLIGFRNPLPQEKALIVPLLNPNEVIQAKPARFGDPILLDLDGLGIRDFVLRDRVYWVIGGPYGSGGKSQLYRWAGPGSEPEPIEVNHFGRYNPEAILFFEQAGAKDMLFLSDDGVKMINGCECKKLPDPQQKKFRAFFVHAEEGKKPKAKL